MKIILQAPDHYCLPEDGFEEGWVEFFKNQEWDGNCRFDTMAQMSGQWDLTKGTHWLFYHRVFSTDFGFLLNGSRRMILLSRFGHNILQHFKLVNIDQGFTWGDVLRLSKGDVYLHGAMEAPQQRSAVSVVERYLMKHYSRGLGDAYEVVTGRPEYPSREDRVAYPSSTGFEVVQSITSITRVMDLDVTSRPSTVLPTVTATQATPAAPDQTTTAPQTDQNPT